MIPNPLNNGKRITDGTFPARLVMTRLMTESEIALPMARRQIRFVLVSDFFGGLEKMHRMRKATTKE